MGQMALLDPSGTEEATLEGAWRFRVDGNAVPQGSFKPMLSKTTGFPMLKSDNETALRRWRKHVAKTAEACRPEGWKPLDGPVLIHLKVYRARSPRDYLVDGVTLRKGARRYPDTAPDSDKLERAIFDALTGIAFVNDGRIVSNTTVQVYAGLDEAPGVEVTICALP